MALDGDERGLRVADRLDDLDAMGREEADQPVAQEDRVLGDHDPHGISARSTVGPPAGLVTVRVPSTAATRGRSARCRPVPAPVVGAAAPVVAHLDDETVRVRGRPAPWPRVAPECLATLVRASETTK